MWCIIFFCGVAVSVWRLVVSRSAEALFNIIYVLVWCRVVPVPLAVCGGCVVRARPCSASALLAPPRRLVAPRSPRPPAPFGRAVRVGAGGSRGGGGRAVAVGGGCGGADFCFGGAWLRPAPPAPLPLRGRGASFFVYIFYVCHFVKVLVLLGLRLSFCQSATLSCLLSHCQCVMSFFVCNFASDFN